MLISDVNLTKSSNSSGNQEKDSRISRCKIVFLTEDQRSIALDREDGALEVHKLMHK